MYVLGGQKGIDLKAGHEYITFEPAGLEKQRSLVRFQYLNWKGRGKCPLSKACKPFTTRLGSYRASSIERSMQAY